MEAGVSLCPHEGSQRAQQQEDPSPLPDVPQDGDGEPQGQPVGQGGLQPPRAASILHHGEAADEDEERAAQQLGHAGLDVAFVPVGLRTLLLAVDVHHHLLHGGETALGSSHEGSWKKAGRVLVAAGPSGTIRDLPRDWRTLLPTWVLEGQRVLEAPDSAPRACRAQPRGDRGCWHRC